MIADNIRRISSGIASACARVKRSAQEVRLVAVAKSRTAEELKEVVEAGIFDIGENRLQEALKRRSELSAVSHQLSAVKWHMIGHLQTNKVKEAVKIFSLIHSVDSLRLAEEIDKEASKINKIQDILIQVNTSGEASKFGLKPEDSARVTEQIGKLKNLRVCGLMTIAPITDSPEKSRPFFRQLRELKDRINELGTVNYELRTLSMGMSDDFEVAIEEGSTMVRIGRRIFGN
ncbi:MAG: YggS family pyridoxal phosphate-dependent enzyme [Candidatus Omnitrophota bacterium]|jgi:pyridoxal phosphate enzyme (YggS family)|nr:MAG: YggS family pyridoxal phosphate-dependent enzyme [Candidatus Omnitrophota bacterium]